MKRYTEPKSNFIQTNSAVYRWRFREGLPEWFWEDLIPGDWHWLLLHAETGEIGFIPEVMSVYRRHAGAYYNNAFISPVAHRRRHGMAELKTYKAINGHFNGPYFIPLSKLANGIFSNFVQLEIESGDDTLLEDACMAYPDFARKFLKDIKSVQASHPHKETQANKA